MTKKNYLRLLAIGGVVGILAVQYSASKLPYTPDGVGLLDIIILFASFATPVALVAFIAEVLKYRETKKLWRKEMSQRQKLQQG